MIAGIQAISALTATGSRDLYRSLDPRFFTDDEQPAWRFFSDCTKRHGAFPSQDVMANHGLVREDVKRTASRTGPEVLLRYAPGYV